MKCAHVILVAALALGLGAARTSAADEGHEGHAMPAVAPEKLGTVRFYITSRSDTQREFNRAVALLHSFQYEQAEDAFRRIAKSNPKLGMAYWGIAMSNYHPIWGPSTSAEFERGLAAAQRAAKLGARTPREREYIKAIGTYYQGATRDFPARKASYETAMAALHQHYPDDLEGTILYALAILGTSTATDKTYAKQHQAADLLNAVLPKLPDHPGVAHYLIHSLDYPSLAQDALAAARAYAKIAPSSPHAQHMPSHIFTRLGLWEESIQSNLASAQTSRELMAKTHPAATHFDELHAQDYLEYAYLQLGKEEEAKGVVTTVRTVSKVDQPTFAAAYAFAAVPARYALERHQWAEAAALTLGPAWFPWKDFAWAEAVTHWAKGLGAARTSDLATARAELTRLGEIRSKLTNVKEGYNWADQVHVQELSLQAWIAHADKQDQDALAKLREAADLEDSIDKHPVTPGAVLPAREQLGDLLVELRRPDDAGREYETVLKAAPGRRNSLLGLENSKRVEAPATGPSSTPPSR